MTEHLTPEREQEIRARVAAEERLIERDLLRGREIIRLRAELASRPTRASAYRDAADAIDATFTGPDNDRYARYGADLLRRLATAAERDDAGNTRAGGESTRAEVLSEVADKLRNLRAQYPAIPAPGEEWKQRHGFGLTDAVVLVENLIREAEAGDDR